jgi:hypothetical protein
VFIVISSIFHLPEISSMAGYIPRPDADFDAWQANFMTVVTAAPGDYGLVAGDLTVVTALAGAWATAYPAHTAAQAEAQASRQAKDVSRSAFESAVRVIVRRIQAAPAVIPAAKAAAGISVPDTKPTPTTPPTTSPTATVDTRERLRHTIHFRDSTTPTSKAKPAGVHGAEIWMKIGTPAPVDPSELSFVTLDTRTPHVIAFDGADAGKTVTYWLRWVSTGGEVGPWGPAVAATVTG